MPETVNLVDRTTGRTFGVPAEQVAAYTAQGFRPESDEESIDRTAAETFHAEHGGAAGAVGSALAGGLSGLTLGLSDQAIGALGGSRVLRHMEAEHPYAAGGGQFVGALLPTVLTGGAAAGEEAAGIGARILAHTPAGMVGRAGGAISGLGEGAGLAGRVVAGTAGAAAEGALYGGGQYLTETALEDKPLSAEGFVAGMGHGALFAAPIGAGGTLASATLQRARALFPRSEVSAAAAAGVKEQASGALAQTVRDGDMMVQAAERRLGDIDAGTGMAQAGETTTRRVFGGADPQALADQVTGATARQEVGQALEGYQQARQQFEDWLANEADPAFAAAMGKIEGHRPALEQMLGHADQGDLETLLEQVGGGAPHDEQLARAMRETLAQPDVLGTGGIPIGEFGAPGARGIKTPEELQRALEGSAGDGVAPVLTPEDATGAGGPRALRSQGAPVGGVPAQEIVQQGMAEQPTTAVGRRTADRVPKFDDISANDAGTTRLIRPSDIDHQNVHIGDAGKGGPIEITADADGHYMVSSGGDQLTAAAAAGDRPVAVRFRPDADASFTDEPHVGSVIGPALGRDVGQPFRESEAELRQLRSQNPQLADDIESFFDVKRKETYKKPRCAHGMCDALDPEFRQHSKVPMSSHRFDMYSDDGLAELKRLYHMTDAEVGHWKEELGHRIRDGHVPKSDMYHQVSVTKDGIVVDWTANQLHDLPVPYVFRLPAPEASTAAGDDLLAALSGTKSAIDKGAELADIGGAEAAATRAEQLMRHPDTADRFLAKAGATDAAQAFRTQALEARAAAEPEVGDATMGRILAKHGLGEPAPAVQLSKAEHQVLGRERVGINSIQRDLGIGHDRAKSMLDDLRSRGLIDAEGHPAARAAAAEPDTLAARILRNEARPGAIAPTSAVSDAAVAGDGKLAAPMTKAELVEQRTRFRAVAPEQRAAKAIMRHNGKGVDMGPALAREAKVIGDMEGASARLADALGSEAPPTAAANAKAFHAATGQAQERAAASSAKLGADLQHKVPAMTGGTVVDDDVAKALRKHESRAAAREAPPTAAPASGIGGKAADLGSALEVMRAIGMHVPAISHIPVIGPVLGFWLKARAVMGILGRKGGSIGKSTEGLIAGKAAAVQDRIVAATGALLEGGARAAGKASHLAGPAVLLAGALFPGGGKPKGDSARDLFEARSDDITRAMQPGAVDQAIAQRYPTSDPAMHDAIVAQVQRGIAFLDSKRPKQTVLPGVLPGDGTWKASAAAIDEFGKFVHAVNDPVSVLEDLAKGHPSAEGAETLRVVYPQLYQYAQKQLLAAAPQMATTLPYSRRVMLSILYQIPVDGTMQPSHAQYLQIPAPPSAAPKASATTGPLRLGQQTMSPLDQRASGA